MSLRIKYNLTFALEYIKQPKQAIFGKIKNKNYSIVFKS